MIIRPLIALSVSAIIAGGTWFTVAQTNNDAQRTAKDIQQRSLEYQRDMHKATKDAVEGTRSTEDIAKDVEESSEAMADDVIDTVQADDNVPAEVKAQLEAAQAQLKQD